MQNKAGVFIGDALITTPNYPVSSISFRNVNLGPDGLYRLLEGVNPNPHVARLHIGIVSDQALCLLAERLRFNQGGLAKLEFQEGKRLID
jgi:hypothetical protein